MNVLSTFENALVGYGLLALIWDPTNCFDLRIISTGVSLDYEIRTYLVRLYVSGKSSFPCFLHTQGNRG